jgi:hypothetical protein
MHRADGYAQGGKSACVRWLAGAYKCSRTCAAGFGQRARRWRSTWGRVCVSEQHERAARGAMDPPDKGSELHADADQHKRGAVRLHAPEPGGGGS